MAKNIRKNNLYVLKAEATKSGNNYVFYKIGELVNAKRDDNLIDKYTKNTNRLVSKVTEVALIPLPHNDSKRLTDIAVHNYIKKHPELNLKHVNKDLIEGIFDETDGYNEFFEVIDVAKETNIKDVVTSIVEQLAKDSVNFTARFKPELDIDIDQDYKHQVTGNNVDKIIEFTRTSNDLITKLFVGQFDPHLLVAKAARSKIVIWNDNSDIRKIKTGINSFDANIVYYNDVREEIYDMNNQFEIIANPPYGLTGQFIKSMLDNVNFTMFVIIAPLSDILPFYRHVRKINLADPKAFTDAAITKNLCIAEITKYPCDIFSTKDDLNLVTYNSDFSKIYEGNIFERHNESIETFKNGGTHYEERVNLSAYKDFMVVSRTPDNGVHQYNNCVDIRWNIYKDETNIPNDKTNKIFSADFIHFATEEEMNNFTQFWYNSKLMHVLIKGLNKNSGSILHAIPKVDWSRTWSADEILAEFGYSVNDIANLKAKYGL